MGQMFGGCWSLNGLSDEISRKRSIRLTIDRDECAVNTDQIPYDNYAIQKIWVLEGKFLAFMIPLGYWTNSIGEALVWPMIDY